MSVDNYKYQCDHCGHTENQYEGIYLFSDKCYTTLQCPQRIILYVLIAMSGCPNGIKRVLNVAQR